MVKVEHMVLDSSYIRMITKMISECDPLQFVETDTPERLQEFIDRGMVLGLFVEGDLIAYAALSIRTELQDLFSKYNVKTNRNVWEDAILLSTCVVKDTYRGYGLQKRLIELREIVARDSGYKEVFTSVNARNIYSINNLIKTGYKQIGKHYIGNEWLLYGKSLTSTDTI